MLSSALVVEIARGNTMPNLHHDVFPLPLIAPCNKGEGKSRGVKQRHCRMDKVFQRSNESISTLNSLFFGPRWDHSQTPICKPSPNQISVQTRVVRAHCRNIKLAGLQGPEEALRALLQRGAGYEHDPGCLATFMPGQVSLPPEGQDVTSLARILEGEPAYQFAHWEEEMLLSPEDMEQ